MELHEFISRDRILTFDEENADKAHVLKSIYDHCASLSDLHNHQPDVWETLIQREKSMSTGIGLGIAIPHCSTEYVDEVTGVLALLKHGIDFDAIDDIPVQIIVLLLLPKNKFEKHIKTLASVAKLFNNEAIRKQIIEAADGEEIFEIIQAATAHD